MNTHRQELAQRFNQALELLNPEQKEAVETIEGPVMVIAGPGTGKTQILAARIGNILKQTDTQAENILCLTYTESGAVAMRQRLQSFIGSDAFKVRINTFHAFCNDVIQEHLHLFRKNELEPISDLERIEIIKSIIQNLPKGNILKRYRGNVDYEIKNLQSLYETMKREHWSPELLYPKIDAYLEDLPNKEGFYYKRGNKKRNIQKGDPHPKKIAEETRRMDMTRAAIATFPQYQKLMDQKERYDFADMITWVIEAFQKHPDLQAEYQEQFLYILVDEFQDTSGAQNDIIQSLCGEEENPNLFVVGDDDQSIFRFQGANVKNMEDLALKYKNYLRTIVLTTNYRSVQPILDTSQALIQNNKERLVNILPNLEKVLTAGNPKLKNLKPLPQFLTFDNYFSEMAGLSYAIEELIKKEEVPAHRIAVIYSQNKYGSELSHYLQKRGIPFFIKRKANVLEDPFIKKLLNILIYISRELDIPYSGENLLFEILHYDFYGIPTLEIAKIMSTVSRTRGKKKTSLRAYLQDWLDTKNPSLFDKNPHAKILHRAQQLEERISDAVNKTLTELVELVIRKDGFLSAALKSNQKVWYMQLLTGFFNFIKLETQRRPDLSLSQLIETFTLMNNSDLSLPIHKTIETEEGVHLLTAHGAKGLEYEVVFLAGSESDRWETSRGSNKGYKLPDNISSGTDNEVKMEEKRRLFFVGITRAEKQLFISRALANDAGKEKEASAFLAEIKEGIDLPESHPHLSQEQLLDFAALNFTEIKQPRIQDIEKQYVSDLLSHFSLSVTALNNYLECPLKFYYNNLIRIPAGKSEALEFGSAVHFALEQLFRNMQDNEDNTFPPIESVLKSFHYYMKRNRQHFTKEAFERRSEYGDKILSEYYQSHVKDWNKVVSVERNISNIVVRGIPLKGKMDKLEFDGNSINVVDYKTGNVESDYTRKKLKSPSEKEPLGGDYWRQAVFYKILLDHYKQKNWKVTSTEFDFVEPNKAEKYITKRIDIQPGDTDIVLQQIEDTWKKIQNHDFYTGCGKEDCYYCNFVKDNNLAVNIKMEEDE